LLSSAAARADLPVAIPVAPVGPVRAP
ncbi:MAG: hypothetical protein QOK35_2115, partial [Pseudonocardiales bacterium]|nr:hypothetical protein [Pseudonocardiales bacterium]